MLPIPSLEKRELNGLSVLTDEALFNACGVRIAFTEREGGVSEGPYASLNTASHVGDDLACVQRNRERVLTMLGGVASSSSLIVPNQVHGTNIVKVASADDVSLATEQVAEGADAVLVGAPGVTALLNFADCLSLIIVAPDGWFAVAHAGWRGALAGIAGKAACVLAAESAADPAEFNAYIGPHIRSECFETSEEIAIQFADTYGADVLADPRHISLACAVSTDLVRAGLVADRIADSGICTVCNANQYFSYRASGGTCGRHAALAIRM